MKGKSEKTPAAARVCVGIDFGTTHTIVSVEDSGNYPILNLPFEYGDEVLLADRVPSCITFYDHRLYFGPAARQCYLDHFHEGAILIRSLKRLLKDWHEGRHLYVGALAITIEEVLTSFLAQLRTSILRALDVEKASVEAVIAVPANAPSSQRYVTLSCFKNAGFKVLRILDEPVASAIQFVHERYKRWDRVKSDVLIYDLGGGTFDTTFLSVREGQYDPVLSRGISRLGGDDFDEALVRLVEEDRGRAFDEGDRIEVLEAARLAKEKMTPNTRNLHVETPDGVASISARAFREAVQPLAERSIELVETVLAHAKGRGQLPDRICLVGGGSLLPLIASTLRKRYGRSKVHQGLYPLESVAIGAAIQAATPDLEVKDRLMYHFGVIRVREDGSEYVDVIFEKGRSLPGINDVARVAVAPYDPRHNIGRFQYLECDDLDTGTGKPRGEPVYWNEILFPYDRSVNPEGAVPVGLAAKHIQPTNRLLGERIVEEYYLDEFGIVTTRISRTSQDRFSNCYNLFRRD